MLKYLIAFILFFILWYFVVGFSMVILHDFIRERSDFVQLVSIIIVWVAISALMIWLGERVLKFLNKQNPNE